MDAIIPFLKHLIDKKVITTQDRRVEEIVERAKRCRTQFEWDKEQRINQKARDIKPLHEALGDNAWRGHRCFIIGGGPSLKGFNFKRLKGEKIIAVNRAYEQVPFADIMFSMDSRYFQWIAIGQMACKEDGQKAHEKYYAFEGMKVWVDTHNFCYKDIYCVKGIEAEGVSFSLQQGIYHGNNSGYAAINLAVCLGANPIYLLGFDMNHTENGETHWHDGYPAKQDLETVQRFIPHFNYLAKALKDTKFKVINLNNNSALSCFQKKKIKDVLK